MSVVNFTGPGDLAPQILRDFTDYNAKPQAGVCNAYGINPQTDDAEEQVITAILSVIFEYAPSFLIGPLTRARYVVLVGMVNKSRNDDPSNVASNAMEYERRMGVSRRYPAKH